MVVLWKLATKPDFQKRIDADGGFRDMTVAPPEAGSNTARTAAIKHVINTFFGGSAEDAAVALLQMSDTKLPADAVERLAREVQKARKEGR